MGDGGKGSAPRPFSVSQEEYDNRWDAIFGRDLKTSESEVCALCKNTSKTVRATTDLVGVESPEYAVQTCPECGAAK